MSTGHERSKQWYQSGCSWKVRMPNVQIHEHQDPTLCAFMSVCVFVCVCVCDVVSDFKLMF